jgi:hypothetical protein
MRLIEDMRSLSPEEVVGRDAELAAIGSFLEAGPGSALLREGEAGAGKTTLVRAGVAQRTLTVRIDRTAPTLDCSATPDVLWPANHELARSVDGGCRRRALRSLRLHADRVESSEPDDAPGAGDGITAVPRDVR